MELKHQVEPTRWMRQKTFGTIAIAFVVFGVLACYRSIIAQSGASRFGEYAISAWSIVTLLLLISAMRRPQGFELAMQRPLRACIGSAILISIASGRHLIETGSGTQLVHSLFSALFALYVLSGSIEVRLRKRSHPLSAAQKLDIWLPQGFGEVLIRDLKIVGHAFWSPAPATDRGSDQLHIFSNHFVARPMLYAFLAIASIELVIGHILLRSLDQWIGNLHLALGVLFCLYIIGIIRSFSSLPTTVIASQVDVRMSVMFHAKFRADQIRNVSGISSLPISKGDAVANAAIVVAPNTLIELKEPLEVQRLFKPPMKTRFIALYLDDAQAFMSHLEAILKDNKSDNLEATQSSI